MSQSCHDSTLASSRHSGCVTELDIYVYLAHLNISEIQLRELIDQAFADLDWGSLSAKISFIVHDDLMPVADIDSRVTLVRSSDGALAFRIRCRELEAAPHDVVVCFGAFLPSVDVIGQLRVTLRKDFMVSAAAPRIALEPLGHLVIVGDQSVDGNPTLIDRKQSAVLPPFYYMPEDLYPCLCIKEDMFGNIDPYDEFRTFPGVLLTFLAAARRRGFLMLIDNFTVLSVSAYHFDRRLILDEVDLVRARLPERALVEKRQAQHRTIAEEQRMWVPAAARERDRPCLLLDCTNIGMTFNGTVECAFGILKGISSIDWGGWDVCAMLNHDARRFFDAESRFPRLRIVDISDARRYDIALRLAQAWSLETVLRLSQRARSIAVTMLDVIGPDVIYPSPDGCDETFQFVGEHADGIIYISEFTRQQFRRRYFTSPEVMEAVIHLTLDPADYVSGSVPDPSDAEWILIFGNAYHHKDLARTVEILATAFPFEKFKVVGTDTTGLANVEGFLSGDLDKSVIDGFFRYAKCVIFPSFYEGFGFPILSGLSYGKTVVARHSSLLHELAAVFPNVGRLVEFKNSLDLVPIVASLLNGADCPTVSLGTHSTAIYGWDACGTRVLEFATQLRSAEKPYRWQQRDRALQYVFAAR